MQRMPILTALFITACGGDSTTDRDTADVAVDSGDTIDIAPDTGSSEVEDADSSGDDVAPLDTSLVDTAEASSVDTDDTSPSDATDTTAPDPWDLAPSQLAVTQTTFVGGTTRTVVGGALWDGAQPEMYALEQDGGFCRLFLGENYFCDPPCVDALCTAPDPDDVCTPYPALLSAGPLTVSGGDAELVIRPTLDGYASEEDGARWQAGDALTFSAPGGDVPAFSTVLRMVEPLVPATADAFDQLSLKAPLVLTWAPPTTSGEPTRVRVRLQADRGQHGRAYAAILECDVPDTGRFEVPAALQERYAADDVWGCGKCPASSLTRYTKARVDAGGHAIDVRVESQLLFLLTPWTGPAGP